MPPLIDGRGMQPPEPLELALAALDSLGSDQVLTMLLHCRPQPLFDILQRNGYAWRESMHPDGTHELEIRKA